MNILIIGGTGFIGNPLSTKLMENHNVFIISNKKNIGENYFNIDIKDVEQIKKIAKNKQIDCIVHLANTMLPKSQFIELEIEFENIILPTFELIEFASEEKMKFVYFSSGGTIYGDGETSISSRPQPISYYGYSKLVIEEFLMLKQRSGMDILILRPSNPYGPGQDLFAKQGLIAVALGKIINNEELILFSDLNSSKDYIYIDDLVKICEILIVKCSGIYNVGSGSTYSIMEILETIQKISGRKLLYRIVNNDINFTHSFKLDISNTMIELSDFKFKNIEKGIELFINEINEGDKYDINCRV